MRSSAFANATRGSATLITLASVASSKDSGTSRQPALDPVQHFAALSVRGKSQVARPAFSIVLAPLMAVRFHLRRYRPTNSANSSNSERHNPPYLTLMAGNEAAYIAPTARIDPGAEHRSGTRIGEYCVIESDVIMGSNACWSRTYT